jgi:hypothetical protein
MGMTTAKILTASGNLNCASNRLSSKSVTNQY